MVANQFTTIFHVTYYFIESDIISSYELHQMTKSDLESKAVMLRETEAKLKDELTKYSVIFDNVFNTLSINKDRSTQQQVGDNSHWIKFSFNSI